jgi:hypothetical protein
MSFVVRHHSPPPIKFTTDAALLRGMGELVAWIYDRTKRVRWLWVVALFAVVGVSLLSASARVSVKISSMHCPMNGPWTGIVPCWMPPELRAHGGRLSG